MQEESLGLEDRPAFPAHLGYGVTRINCAESSDVVVPCVPPKLTFNSFLSMKMLTSLQTTSPNSPQAGLSLAI